MTTYAVQYEYADDPQGMDAHRAAHRGFLGGLADEGMVLLGGRYADDGPAGALIVMRARSADEVREVLRDDPFQQQGLVTEVVVREWPPILGAVLDALPQD